MAVHPVVPGQTLPPGIDQRLRPAARTDAAELLVCGGVRADEGRLVRRGHAVAVREDYDSRGLGVVAVEQILHGEHGFLRKRRLRVPPCEHRAAAVRKAVHGGVSERAVGQLHAADVGALQMADHGERQTVQLLHRGRAAHERLGHGGLVVLHVGGGLLLDEVDQLVHAVLAALHIGITGQPEYHPEEQQSARKAQAGEGFPRARLPVFTVQAHPPPDCARGRRDTFRRAFPCCRPRASAQRPRSAAPRGRARHFWKRPRRCPGRRRTPPR